MRIGLIINFFTHTKFYIISDFNVLGDNCFVDFAVLADARIIHNDRISYHSSFFDRNPTTDY